MTQEVLTDIEDVDSDELVSEIEKWLTATVSRDMLDSRDIRELQNLLIDVRTALVPTTGIDATN